MSACRRARSTRSCGGYLTVRSLEHNGRLRKYYHITPSGLARIGEFRDEWEEILAIYRFVTREEDHG